MSVRLWTSYPFYITHDTDPTRAYRCVAHSANRANSSGDFGGLVWCGASPRCSGV